tara:strand:+ start:119053 stop:119478 length:426 start_codon:yes stop_codon:yes gene_type:complete
MKLGKIFRDTLKEEIRANEAYDDFDAMMTVLRGKRDVTFLLGPTIEVYFDKYIKNNDKVKLMVVPRKGFGIYGDGYILYSNLEKAKHLHSIMMKHDGYLSDDTPEEAIENGEALEYVDQDIKAFVTRIYGEGAYEKAKNIK